MENVNKQWPAWFNGPHGEEKIFNSAEEVPAGWTTGAEKRSAGPMSAPPPPPPPPPPAGADKPDLDADGHPWSAELHASSKSKTKAGLWRMAVGKARPAPAPGYPLDL